MQKLYIHPTTSFTPVQLALSHSLRAAALAELLPSSGGTISPVTLYDEAEDAFKALSELLGEDEWFFGAKEPGFFDASVFSYLYLILEGLEWIDGELRERARRSENLVEFVERVRGRYYKEVGKRVGR
jgi:metaxin